MGRVAHSALFSKWYYEVTIDYVERASHMPLHFRVGWASTKGSVSGGTLTLEVETVVGCVKFPYSLRCWMMIWFGLLRYVPYPGGGEKWGGNGVGDDLFSFGFDGANLWTGGRSSMVLPSHSQVT